MHYYNRNIGDYAKKAGRLSMLEHGAYTNLLDSIYDREQFPTLDEALDWTWARTDEEMSAVKFVLSKFFKLVDGVYVQSRIQDELDAYQSKSLTNKRIAQDREAKRRTKKQDDDGYSGDVSTPAVHDLARNVHEACTTGHLTNNQEPITNTERELGECEIVADAQTEPTPAGPIADNPTGGLSALQVLAYLKTQGVVIGQHGYLASHAQLGKACGVGVTPDVLAYAWEVTVSKGKQANAGYFFATLTGLATDAQAVEKQQTTTTPAITGKQPRRTTQKSDNQAAGVAVLEQNGIKDAGLIADFMAVRASKNIGVLTQTAISEWKLDGKSRGLDMDLTAILKWCVKKSQPNFVVEWAAPEAASLGGNQETAGEYQRRMNEIKADVESRTGTSTVPTAPRDLTKTKEHLTALRAALGGAKAEVANG